MTLPTLFIPHGAGPCFFMDWTRGPADTWDRTAAWLKGIVADQVLDIAMLKEVAKGNF